MIVFTFIGCEKDLIYQDVINERDTVSKAAGSTY
jgi:hypothetical protein